PSSYCLTSTPSIRSLLPILPAHHAHSPRTPLMLSLCFLLLPPPPTFTLFPYTTLFRSPPAARGRTAAPHLPPPRAATCGPRRPRSEEHTSELQSLTNLVCRLLLEKKKKKSLHCRLNVRTDERLCDVFGVYDPSLLHVNH